MELVEKYSVGPFVMWQEDIKRVHETLMRHENLSRRTPVPSDHILGGIFTLHGLLDCLQVLRFSFVSSTGPCSPLYFGKASGRGSTRSVSRSG